MARKQFKIKHEEVPELEFDLVFEKEDGEEVTEPFTARGRIPGNTLLALAAAAAEENGALQAYQLRKVLDESIVPGDLERWHKTLDDPAHIVELQKLAEVVAWLTEEYGSRPTSTA